MAEIRIGISGFRYAGWRGVFYPRGLPQGRELEFAARHFNSIELNGSFYSLQRPAYYSRWRDEAPFDERFAAFLELLPKNTQEAQALAKRHDARVAGRSAPTTRQRRRLRHAVEVRNRSFCSPELIALLRRHPDRASDGRHRRAFSVP